MFEHRRNKRGLQKIVLREHSRTVHVMTSVLKGDQEVDQTKREIGPTSERTEDVIVEKQSSARLKQSLDRALNRQMFLNPDERKLESCQLC